MENAAISTIVVRKGKSSIALAIDGKKKSVGLRNRIISSKFFVLGRVLRRDAMRCDAMRWDAMRCDVM
jgi:hypothetical protein